MSRPPWVDYFLKFADAAASRSTCDRKNVGAVIVVDRQIVATGYNGSIAGLPHCDEAGHDMKDGHCVRTIHAEMNAIAQAAKHGVAIDGASIYTTASPCWECFRILVNAGVKEFCYREPYRTEEDAERISAVVDGLGLTLSQIE